MKKKSKYIIQSRPKTYRKIPAFNVRWCSVISGSRREKYGFLVEMLAVIRPRPQLMSHRWEKQSTQFNFLRGGSWHIALPTYLSEDFFEKKLS